MLEQFMQLQLADKYGIKSDRIVFTESIDGLSTKTIDLSSALNGAALKNNLVSLDYFLTKYAIWSQNGIVEVILKPDNETPRSINTYALTQKVEAPFVPLIHISTDLLVTLTNNLETSDDVYIIIDMWKLPQGNVPAISDLSNSMISAIGNIDIQTLGIEKFLTITNILLQAIVLANKGIMPDLGDTPTIELPAQISERTCRRP